MSNKISIILCSFNEAKHIENAIIQLEKHIPNLELVIVDDSSTDGTIELLNKLNINKRFKLIVRKKSKGLASAFFRGLIETTGDYIGWIDTNMGEVSEKFSEMISELNNNSDVVVLSRYVKGGGDERVFLRSMGSTGYPIIPKLVVLTIRPALFTKSYSIHFTALASVYFLANF